jgi:DNA-binding NtrC family response regulator
VAHILIVDDEIHIRTSLRGVLADEGYESDATASAEDALALLRARPGYHEVVLLDVTLPGMEGTEALGTILSLPAAPLVLMMSGHGTLAMAVDCTKRGAFDFLEKPLQPERLLVALRNAIAARRLETERAELLDRLGETSTLLGDSPVMQRLRDEIGDRSLETQAKLLRVLEESELERVGGTETVRLDVRVVAATNKNLGDEIAHGAFREDLYHRLAVIVLRVPPLRERGRDIARLAQHFLQRACMDNNRRPRRLMPDAVEWLSGYRWPGNVRELRNMMERAAIMLDGDEIGAADLEPRSFGAAVVPAPSNTTTLRGSIEEHERRMLEQALAAARGNVAGAARSLGMDRANLHRKLRRLGIPTSPHRTGPHDSPAA